jgi:hypothetical protein
VAVRHPVAQAPPRGQARERRLPARQMPQPPHAAVSYAGTEAIMVMTTTMAQALRHPDDPAQGTTMRIQGPSRGKITGNFDTSPRVMTLT